MKPRFSVEIIGELRRRAVAHNRAMPDPAFQVKLGPLKGLYKRYFGGKYPHVHALDKIDEHLERLRLESKSRKSPSSSARPARRRTRARPTGPPPPDPDEQTRTLPAPVRIEAVLFPADFREALKVAGIDADPGEQALFKAAAVAVYVAHKVVSAHFVPTIGQIREVLDRLGEIERACLTVYSQTMARLPAAPPAENALDALARDLSRSRDPVVMALLDAANALDGGEADGRRLAEALIMNARVRSWSGAAWEQYAAGTTREKVSRRDPVARSPARSLGTVLIETYVSLSGGKVGFSRIKPDAAGAGEPTGPLIHYLNHLFERARHNLSLDPERAQLQSLREWNPAPETLAAWIRQFRTDDRDL